jgi:hypothetical protein
MVEIATVGDEGVLGINPLHGDFRLGGETMMQGPDTDAELLPIAIFKRELDWRSPARVCSTLLSGLADAHDAIDRVHGAAPGAAAVLSMAADDARSRAAGRLPAQS